MEKIDRWIIGFIISAIISTAIIICSFSLVFGVALAFAWIGVYCLVTAFLIHLAEARNYQNEYLIQVIERLLKQNKTDAG